MDAIIGLFEALGELFSAMCEGIGALVESIIGFGGLLIEKPQLIVPVLAGMLVIVGAGYYFITDALKQASPPSKVEAAAEVQVNTPPVKRVTLEEAKTVLKTKATQKAKDLFHKYGSVH